MWWVRRLGPTTAPRFGVLPTDSTRVVHGEWAQGCRGTGSGGSGEGLVVQREYQAWVYQACMGKSCWKELTGKRWLGVPVGTARAQNTADERQPHSTALLTPALVICGSAPWNTTGTHNPTTTKSHHQPSTIHPPPSTLHHHDRHLHDHCSHIHHRHHLSPPPRP